MGIGRAAMTHLIVSHGEFTPDRLAYILNWLADHLDSEPVENDDDVLLAAKARLRDVLERHVTAGPPPGSSG